MQAQAKAKGSKDKSQRSKVIGRRSLWNCRIVELWNCGTVKEMQAQAKAKAKVKGTKVKGQESKVAGRRSLNTKHNALICQYANPNKLGTSCANLRAGIVEPTCACACQHPKLLNYQLSTYIRPLT